MDLVSFLYVNHRGKTETRHVRPIRIWYGSTAWHTDPGWMLEAFCLDRQATRDFSMSGILGEWQRWKQ